MRKVLIGVFGALVLSGSALGAECSKKRVDKCGCHHQFGLRHCHPNRKSVHCEAPVKATQQVKLETAKPKPVSM